MESNGLWWLIGVFVSAVLSSAVGVWLLTRRSAANKRRAEPRQAAPASIALAPEPAAARGADATGPGGESAAAVDAGPPRGATPFAVVLAAERDGALLADLLELACVRVNNAEECLALVKRRRPSVLFVAIDLLPQLDGRVPTVPIVGIIDDAPSQNLRRIVEALDMFSAVSHLICASLLSTTVARAHLTALVDRLCHGAEHDMLGSVGVGRIAMLAQASHREARFERMNDYLGSRGLSPRTLAAVAEVAEELVMNALYNAPAEAGYFQTPVSRTDDVILPADRACEISYGVEDGNVFVRLRDTFGTLRRERLLEVLERCTTPGVALDESRGGAGLGLWRVFSAATTVAITVTPGRQTDIVVRIAPRQGRAVRQLLAVHLFFVPDAEHELDLLLLGGDSSLIDHSITLVA